MHTCHDIHEKASAFLDGELSDEETAAWQGHLELCPPCDNFYRSFETTVRRAREALVVEVPEGLAEEMMARVHRALAG